MKRWILVAILGMIAIGAGFYMYYDPNSELNKRFPAVQTADQRWLSATQAISDLDLMEPKLVAGFSGATIQRVLADAVRHDRRLSNIGVTISDGVVQVAASFKGPLNDNAEVGKDGWPTDPKEVAIAADIVGLVDLAFKDRHVLLLPSFQTLRVRTVKYGFINASTDALEPLIKALLTRLNGVFTASDASRLKVDIEPIRIDLAAELKKDPRNVSVQASPTSTEMRIARAALLPVDTELLLVAEIQPTALIKKEDGASNSAEIVGDKRPGNPLELGKTEQEASDRYRKAVELFGTVAKKVYAKKPTGEAWIALPRSLIYQTFNVAFPTDGVCLTRVENGLVSKINAEPRLFELPVTDCMMHEDCTRRYSCDRPYCKPNRDNRDCMERWSICTPSWLGNTCAYSDHENPACVIGRNAQDALYLAEQAACETKRAADIAGCEAGKAAEQAVCEAAKLAANLACERLQAILPQIQDIGKVGTVSGSATIDYQASSCVTALRINETTERLSGSITLQGAAQGSASIDFMPTPQMLLACLPMWNTTLKATANVKPIERGIGGQISFANATNDAGKPVVRGKLVLDPQTLKAKLDEPLIASLFKQNPQLLVQCAPLIANLGVPALGYALVSGDFDNQLILEKEFEVKDLEIGFNIDAVKVETRKEAIELLPKLNGMAIELAGSKWAPIEEETVAGGCIDDLEYRDGVIVGSCREEEAVLSEHVPAEAEEIGEMLSMLSRASESVGTGRVASVLSAVTGAPEPELFTPIVLPPNYPVQVGSSLSADGPDVLLGGTDAGKCIKADAVIYDQGKIIEQTSRDICGTTTVSMKSELSVTGTRSAIIRLTSPEPNMARFRFVQ